MEVMNLSDGLSMFLGVLRLLSVSFCYVFSSFYFCHEILNLT